MELREYQLLGENIHRHCLENGLEILVDVRPEYAKQFAFFATRYGGMHLRFHNEDGHWVDTPAGVAHFLEHKMFDSEEGNVLQIMAANGAVDNAFTAAAITGYYFECTRGFEENLRTLLSFVTTPYFTEESVAKEQGIIAQEIRMCLDDPDVEVYYQLMEAMYQNHPVRVRVAGSEASIAQITPEVLYRCHEAFYRPDNMVLCVAGSVDPQRVVELAREIVTHTGGGVGQADLGQKEPVQVTTPKSVSEIKIPETNILQILVEPNGKMFMSLDNQGDRMNVLQNVGAQYGVEFTQEEILSFKLLPCFGVPVKDMKAFLGLKSDVQDQALKGKVKGITAGIPCDSVNNELKVWVKQARGVNPDLRIAIKAAAETPYPIIHQLMSSLQDIRSREGPNRKSPRHPSRSPPSYDGWHLHVQNVYQT